jgi:hypothetical protein
MTAPLGWSDHYWSSIPRILAGATFLAQAAQPCARVSAHLRRSTCCRPQGRNARLRAPPCADSARRQGTDQILTTRTVQPKCLLGIQVHERAQRHHLQLLAGPGGALVAELANRKLRRSAHRSVAELEADLTAWTFNLAGPISGVRPGPRNPRVSARGFRSSRSYSVAVFNASYAAVSTLVMLLALK